MDGSAADSLDHFGQTVPIGFLDDLSRTTSSADVLSSYARWANRIIDCDRATVAMAEPGNETMKVMAIEGNKAIANGTRVPISGSFIGKGFSTNAPGMLPDIVEHSEYFECPRLAAGGLRTIMNAPIVSGDRRFGCLAAASRKTHGFDQRDLATITVLARCLGSYLLLHEQLENLSELALVDALTQVYNRRFFQQTISDRWESWVSRGQPFSLVIADIDHFKNVNDTHGHTFGDDVLREVAQVLRDTARPQDIVARIGGEEFAIIHADTSQQDAIAIAERLRQRIGRMRFKAGDEDVQVTVSLGVATTAQPYDSARAMMISADAALYEAKNSGRNRVHSA